MNLWYSRIHFNCKPPLIYMIRPFVAFTIISLLSLLGCKASLGKNFDIASSFNKKPSSPDSTTLLEKTPKPDISPPPETSSNKARFNFPFQQKSNLSYNSIFSITPRSSMDLNADQKEVNKGWLGISMTEKEKSNTKEQSEEKQIVIQYVIEASPAEQFGLQKDDIILKLNGETILPAPNISLPQNFSKQIQKLSSGSSITLTIIRNKVEHDISLILGRKPKAPVIMAKHENLTNTNSTNESLLERVLKQQKMLTHYHKVAGLIKEKSSDIISYRFKPDNYNPFRLGKVNYFLSHPLNVPIITLQTTAQIKKYFNNTDRDFSKLLHLAAKEIDVFYTPAVFYKFPSDLSLDTFLDSVVQLFQKAASIRKDAFSKLSQDDMDFLYSYSKIYIPQTTEDIDEEPKELSEKEEEELLRFLNIALRVDYKKLFYSSQIILHAFNTDTIELLKQLKLSKERISIYDIEQADIVSGDVILNEETEIGRIIIGGPDQTIYREDAAVIIDLGGDDIYYNNAGSSTRHIPISILIDLSGNDTYVSSRPFVQGCGIMGTGILIDLSGDDYYVSLDASQGIGIIGIGFIIDLDGDDLYIGKSSVQGVGLFGMGFILEGGGNDRYLAERYAQGIGFTKGIGGIIEAGGSDFMFAGGKYPDFRDPENATESYAQGFGYGLLPYNISVGASGGIGLVYDQKGNDIYISDYFGQGGSYWYAFGALVDEAGDDLYISGRYSQGAGIHVSIGTLIDEKGDDRYISTFGVGQGLGHDFGIGVLVDNNGNDFYKGGVLVQGLGNETGIGILYDNNGNDEYVSKGNRPGTGNFSSFHETGSIGLFIDSEGIDSYSSEEKNHQILNRKNWGLFLDI